MRSRAGPVTENSDFCDRDLGNRDENYLIWTLQRGWRGRNIFWQNSFAMATKQQKYHNIFLVCFSTSVVVVKLQESRTIQVYVPPFWFCFFNFFPVDQAEISHINKEQHAFVSVTEPARFLNTRKGKTMSLINHFFNLSKEKRKRMFRLGETFWRWPQFVNGFPELCL